MGSAVVCDLPGSGDFPRPFFPLPTLQSSALWVPKWNNPDAHFCLQTPHPIPFLELHPAQGDGEEGIREGEHRKWIQWKLVLLLSLNHRKGQGEKDPKATRSGCGRLSSTLRPSEALAYSQEQAEMPWQSKWFSRNHPCFYLFPHLWLLSPCSLGYSHNKQCCCIQEHWFGMSKWGSCPGPHT